MTTQRELQLRLVLEA
jgi:hypothetical protein